MVATPKKTITVHHSKGTESAVGLLDWIGIQEAALTATRRPKGLIGAKRFLMTLKHIDQNEEEDDSRHFGWRGVAGEDHGNARHASGHLSGETQISHLATQNRPKKVQVNS